MLNFIPIVGGHNHGTALQSELSVIKIPVSKDDSGRIGLETYYLDRVAFGSLEPDLLFYRHSTLNSYQAIRLALRGNARGVRGPAADPLPTPPKSSRPQLTMEFARRDDCLSLMVPSDLRLLISQRDSIQRDRERLAAELEQHKRDAERMREALEEIISPIKLMQTRLEDGYELNGLAAIQIANDPQYLQQIAKQAIAVLNQQQAEVKL